MVETGLTNEVTQFFFKTQPMHAFLAIDHLEEPVYMRKVANATIGSDSHTEKVMRTMREDLGLIRHVDEEGLKKYVEYTDRGKEMLAKLKQAGYRPEEAVYDSE